MKKLWKRRNKKSIEKVINETWQPGVFPVSVANEENVTSFNSGPAAKIF